jgi:hypothetical protein
MTSHTTDGKPRLLPDEVSVKGSDLAVGRSRPVDSRTTTHGGVPAPVARTASRTNISAPPTAVIGTWTTNVIVDASWSVNETRNAFLRIAGGAWKKVFDSSDAAFVALLTLATQAKQTGRPVSLREEADGLVHESYLW